MILFITALVVVATIAYFFTFRKRTSFKDAMPPPPPVPKKPKMSNPNLPVFRNPPPVPKQKNAKIQPKTSA